MRPRGRRQAARPQRIQRLTQLHVAYGNALIAARGYAAPETTEAFARARESASGGKDATEKLAGVYGLWVGGYVRGELPSMRAHAQAFLDDVAARPNSPEAAVAHRVAGITCWFAGGYREARDHFARALEVFKPGRDDDLAFRFGFDPGVGAMGYLASALWPLGEVDRAISLIDRMQSRSAEITHAGTLAFARLHTALFESMRRDPARVESNASELARLAREHKLAFHGAAAAFLEGWVKAQSGAPGGLEEMRRAREQVRQQRVLTFLDLGTIALAEAEARAGDLRTRRRAPRRSAGDGRARVMSRVRSRAASGSRRNPAAARPHRSRASGRRLPGRYRGREAARHAQLRTASRAVARQALCRDRPPRARPRCSRRALEGFSLTSKFPESEEALEIIAAVEPSVRL